MDCEIPVEYSSATGISQSIYQKIPVKLNFIKLQQTVFNLESSEHVSGALTTRPNQIHILTGEKYAIYNTLSLSQITRDFSRYRRECNCQKAIYMGIVRDWQQLTYIGKVCDSPNSPLPSGAAYISECFVIHMPRSKNTAIRET